MIVNHITKPVQLLFAKFKHRPLYSQHPMAQLGFGIASSNLLDPAQDRGALVIGKIPACAGAQESQHFPQETRANVPGVASGALP